MTISVRLSGYSDLAVLTIVVHTMHVPTEVDLLAAAREFATALEFPVIVFLTGDLGTGKTTFVRGVLIGLGYSGRVKSPTFTLVESYDIGGRIVHHLDLYRLLDQEELEYIGFRDLISAADALFIEWPERAAALLPPATHQIRIDYADPGRMLHIDSTA